VQPAGRHDDHGFLAQVTCGRAEDRVLQIRPGRLQDGQRAVRVVPGPAAGQAAQAEPGELRGADGVLGPAGGELPYPPRPADQHLQDAVDLGDLDQPAVAEPIQQGRDVDVGPAGAGPAPGLQRASPDRALQAQLLALERRRRLALPSCFLQSPGHPAQRRETGVQLRVGRGPHRGHGQRGSPPALGPGQ